MMERSFDFGALLQNHQKNHKTRPTQFVSVESGIRKRLENNIKTRKSTRLTVFDSIRNLQRCDTPKKPDPQSKLEHRKMQLEKWKEEKEKKKRQAAAIKKKPFLTGIAHAPLKYEPPPPPRTMPSTTGRVTRSQTSKASTKSHQNISIKASKQQKPQSFAPKNASFKPPELKNLTKLPTLGPQPKDKKNSKAFEFNPVIPSTSKVNNKVKSKPNSKLESNSKMKLASKNDSHNSPILTDKRPTRGRYVKAPSSSQSQSSEPLLTTRTPRKSIQASKMSTPKNPIPKSESSSEERLRSPKSPDNVPMTPEQIAEETKKISPCVTLSRGKDNARKEMKFKMKEGLLQEDASDLESVDHFRRQMDSEIKRMTEMCDTWEKISEQVVLPEAVQEAVLGAVGQARLLMSQKMQQFAELIDSCERPEPGELVTPADLHGFWDMVFMQVENVDMRFKKLEEMRARNWVEEAPVVQRKRVAPRAKPAAKPAAKPVATSRIRDMIAAARKAKQLESKASESPQKTPEESTEPGEASKTFEAGFFCVRSPVRRSAPSTPNRPSLLKAVLSSEAKKSASKAQNCASLAMLRASLIGKNIGNDDVLAEPLVPLTPINLTATPGRSILKPQNNVSTKKSSKKSIKMVLFNESDAENDASLIEGMSEINMDAEKENKSKRQSLVRQNAVEDRSPVMTRSRRKSMSTPLADTKGEEITPRRSSMRKRHGAEK